MGLSVQEIEQLTKSIVTQLKDNEDKNGVKFATEEDFKKAVNDQVRDVMKKSTSRIAPYITQDINPNDMVVIEKALDDPAGEDEAMIKLQEFNDDLYTLTSILKVHPTQLASFPAYERRWSELKKALNTATAGSGLEWVPTGYSSRMIEFIEIASQVASKFFSFRMPTTTYVYPLLLSDGTAYLGGEATTNSPAMYRASALGTDDLTFVAKKHIVNYPASEEMSEDSIVPVLPQLRASLARAMAKGDDNAIINGDTTTTHFDTGYTVAADDTRRSWKGIRRLVSDANAALGLKQDGNTWTTALGLGILRALVEDMGVYNIDPRNLMILVNTNMNSKFKALAEVSTNDKFGNAATIHNGVLTQIDGIDIVLTQHLEESQNATGLYDGTTETFTQFLVVYKPGFWRGIRRDMTLDYVQKPLYGMNYLVATTRRVWKPVYDTTTNRTAGWVYNITK